MTKNRTKLERLQRELDRRAPALPLLCLSYGLDADGLYHGNGRTYTRDEVDELARTHQLIVLTYGDDPRSDGENVIQMTWDEDDEKRTRQDVPGRA